MSSTERGKDQRERSEEKRAHSVDDNCRYCREPNETRDGSRKSWAVNRQCVRHFELSLAGLLLGNGSDVDARRRRPARIPSAASKGCDKEAGTDDGVDRNSGLLPGEGAHYKTAKMARAFRFLGLFLSFSFSTSFSVAVGSYAVRGKNDAVQPGRERAVE